MDGAFDEADAPLLPEGVPAPMSRRNKWGIAVVGTGAALLAVAGLALAATWSSHPPYAGALACDAQGAIPPVAGMDPDGFGNWCALAVGCAKAHRDAAVTAAGRYLRPRAKARGPPLDEVLGHANLVDNRLSNAAAAAQLLAAVSPDPEMMAAATRCSEKAGAASAQYGVDRGLYRALSVAQGWALSGRAPTDRLDRRFLATQMDGFRRGGLELNTTSQGRLLELQAAIQQLGSTFSRNVAEARLVHQEPVGSGRLAGLDPAYVAARTDAGTGMVSISTDTTDLRPALRSANNSEFRAELYALYVSRAFPANEEVLRQLLQKRRELAALLGYPNFAALALQDMMAGSSQVVDDFLDSLDALVADPAADELIDLQAFRYELEGDAAPQILKSDLSYYLDRFSSDRFGVDASDLRPYFRLDAVRQGIFRLAERLFGVALHLVPDAAVWHPSVSLYELREGGVVIGRVYLDLTPRDAKFRHAAVFPIRGGVSGLQVRRHLALLQLPPLTPPFTATPRRNRLQLWLVNGPLGGQNFLSRVWTRAPYGSRRAGTEVRAVQRNRNRVGLCRSPIAAP